MYAVETVRMLADRGVLEQTGDSYVVVGEVDDVQRARNYLQERRADSLLRLLDGAPGFNDSDDSPVSTP